MNVWRFNQATRSVENLFPNGDIISGMRFCAAMQLRTPLRVLLRHGEIFTDLPSDPPPIARAQWEGIWVPKSLTFREMGIDLDEPPAGTMAASIGQIPVDGGNYLKFLIVIREIAESVNSIEERSACLMVEAASPNWVEFTHHQHHGKHDIADYFFPSFLHCVPKLPFTAMKELERLGLVSPAAFDVAADDTLLAVRGIGPKILAVIRAACASAGSDRESVRIDTVMR